MGIIKWAGVSFLIFLCLISGCATVNSEWKKTVATDTTVAYESFIRQYPRSSYAAAAKERIAAKKWEGARTLDTIRAYEHFIMDYPKSSYVPAARERLKSLYSIDSKEVKTIATLQKEKDPKAEEPEIISRLIMAGANCLDGNANWTSIEEGRIIYQTLKNYQGKLVTESMRRVIVTSINRLHVLFLAVKLGIDGSQKALNELLIVYGDKGMAEDYLNSGSNELHDGGAEWAKRNGYSIQTGPGSNRVRWGSF